VHVVASASVTESVENAPDPDSSEFLDNQDTVEKVSPDTTADQPGADPELIDTDPELSDNGERRFIVCPPGARSRLSPRTVLAEAVRDARRKESRQHQPDQPGAPP